MKYLQEKIESEIPTIKEKISKLEFEMKHPTKRENQRQSSK